MGFKKGENNNKRRIPPRQCMKCGRTFSIRIPKVDDHRFIKICPNCKKGISYLNEHDDMFEGDSVLN